VLHCFSFYSIFNSIILHFNSLSFQFSFISILFHFNSLSFQFSFISILFHFNYLSFHFTSLHFTSLHFISFSSYVILLHSTLSNSSMQTIPRSARTIAPASSLLSPAKINFTHRYFNENFNIDFKKRDYICAQVRLCYQCVTERDSPISSKLLSIKVQ
jgi:hypothetical protein